MLRFLTILTISLLLAGQASLAGAITADEVIAQHIAARGGSSAMRAVNSVTRTGRAVIPGFDADMRISDTRARPGKIRQEFMLQGLTQVQAFDGSSGWQIQPFQGRKDPEQMSADDTKSLALAADFDTPLVDYRAKGATAEYLGLEDVEGTPAHKLRLKLKSGDSVIYFIDPDTYMLIRDVQKQIVRGTEQEIETDYGEYEKINGVFFPMSEETGPKGSDSSSKQKSIYETAVVNSAASEATFTFPVAQPAGAAK